MKINALVVACSLAGCAAGPGAPPTGNVLSLPAFGSAGLECQPYENTDEVLAVSETHLIVLGEMHGTNESVEALTGLICAALGAGKPVRVGLEAAAWQGGPLNQLLHPPFDETAVLEAAPEMWQVEDGRGSAAIMALLKQLGEWRSAGFDVSVFAFDYASGELSGEDPVHLARSALMARHVDDAVSDFEGAVFVLTGEFHARKQAVDFGSERYLPMAGQVTRRPVLALKMVYGAGEAWVQAGMEKSDGSYEYLTGPLKLNGTALAGAPIRSFELAGDAEGYFDGSYYTGPITASPPAIRSRSKD